MSRSLLALVIGCSVACRATPAPWVAPSTTDGPGAPWLTPLSLAPDVARWRVTIRGLRDTIDRPFSEKTVTQIPDGAQTGGFLITSVWPPPTTSVDSLIVTPLGLRSIREILAFNGFTRRYQYAGNHVWGTVQHADSAPRTVDRAFPEAVFAFSEVELLVRAVPLHPGWSVVVPLFSESDEDVEHDTITVLAPTQVRREDAWLIRFADPAIVSTYVVLAGSRAILSIDTQQRRSGAVLRFHGI